MQRVIPRHAVYGITPASLMGQPQALQHAVVAALQGGMTILQWRDKLGAGTAEEAMALRALCHAYGAMFLVNDDAALAKAWGADGVHLGAGDGSIAQARALLGPGAIVGATCRDSLALAEQAVADGADYLAFGAAYPSTSKVNTTPLSPQTLVAARQRAWGLPLCVIGGLQPSNLAPWVAAGADWVAAIDGLLAAPDPHQAAQQFTAALYRG